MKNNSIFFCLIIGVLLCTANAHAGCNHDNDEDMKKIYKQHSEAFNRMQSELAKDNENMSNLQGSGAPLPIQPIRVTADSTGLNTGLLTPTQLVYMNSIISTLSNYLKNFIKVTPYATNNILPAYVNNLCINTVTPASDSTTGIPNSDLHLYFRYVNDPTQSYVANAAMCAMNTADNIIYRPAFGQVNINFAQLKANGTSSLKFQNDLHTVLHEIVHVLGFTSSSMQYWLDANKQRIGTDLSKITQVVTFRNLPTTILMTPIVVKTAQKYYGSNQIQGMQLENQGGQGNLGSHWERTIVLNELMAPQELAEGFNLSVFTVALLKDTGFWDDVNENIADQIYWGKGKGWEFYANACQSTQKFEEFSAVGVQDCSFWNDGQGHSQTDGFSDNCNYIASYTNNLCEEIKNQTGSNQQTTNTVVLSDYQYNSKCFDSTLLNPSYNVAFNVQTRCHLQQCNSDSTAITITFSQLPALSVICQLQDQGQVKTVMNTNNKSIGTITCPNNYEKFCNNKNCPNFCSQNGSCQKGQCYCNAGFSGVDCSTPCPKYFDNVLGCVAQCVNSFANPDNTCKPACPKGYYQNVNVCTLCDFSCSQCTGPSNNQCTACQFLTYLQGTQCVSTCQSGFKANDITKNCDKVASNFQKQ